MDGPLWDIPSFVLTVTFDHFNASLLNTYFLSIIFILNLYDFLSQQTFGENIYFEKVSTVFVKIIKVSVVQNNVQIRFCVSNRFETLLNFY